MSSMVRLKLNAAPPGTTILLAGPLLMEYDMESIEPAVVDTCPDTFQGPVGLLLMSAGSVATPAMVWMVTETAMVDPRARFGCTCSFRILPGLSTLSRCGFFFRLCFFIALA